MSFLCFLVCPPCGKAMAGRRACAPGGYDDPGGNDPMECMSWPCIAPSTSAATRFPFPASVPGCEAPDVLSTDSPWGTGSSWSISDSVGAGLVGGCCSALSLRATDSFGSCGGMRSAIWCCAQLAKPLPNLLTRSTSQNFGREKIGLRHCKWAGLQKADLGSE